MKTQPWINFIGIFCIVFGAIGIFRSSWALSYMPFGDLTSKLSPNVPLNIIHWRYGLMYLALFVNIVYFIAGMYFLLKNSFSLKLMYFALILSILFVIFPIIFLSPYSHNPTLSRYAVKPFNFIKPAVNMGLLIGVLIISRNYHPQTDQLNKTTRKKVNYRIPIALGSGIVVPILTFYLTGLASIGCFPLTIIFGAVFLLGSLALGFYWPSFSWKSGLWLIAPMFLIFLPLGLLSSWFAQGWGFAFKILLQCEIFYLIAILITSCLGSYLGSLLKNQRIR